MPILAQTLPVYQPAMRIIEGITNRFNALIVTTFANQYHVGMIVRINMPTGYGMQDLNQKTGTILELIDEFAFIVDIDTSDMDLFSVPTDFPLDRQYPQVTPVGEVNMQLTDATRNVLPY